MSNRSGSGLIAWAIIVAGLLIAPAVSAEPAFVDPLEMVSGPSPFNTCTKDSPDQQGGAVYKDSEVEPWVGVNPVDPLNIVATWQQDRWSNGGARGLVAGVSHDGGVDWKQVVVPGLSLCSDGVYVRASDPWLSFAPNGDLYHVALAFNPGGGGRSAILVSKSFDGGLNWGPPTQIHADNDPLLFNDKESITADPHDPNFVYAVWDRLDFSRNIGPAVISRSTDGGQSWSPIRTVYDPGPGSQTIGNQIVVLPNSVLLDFFTELRPQRVRRLAFRQSPNRGVTWLPRLGSSLAADLQPQSAVVPGTRQRIRDGSILFDVAVDRIRGTLVAVWQDGRFSGFQYPSVAFSISTDSGTTWSAPVPIDRTPASPDRFLRQAFIPSIHIAASGMVGVSYYDFRNDGPESSGLADYWLTWCHPAASDCTNPARWRAEVRLTGQSFDLTQAPLAGGLFIGDYVGLSAAGDDFIALFSQTHDGDRASAFVRRVVIDQPVDPEGAGYWKHRLRLAVEPGGTTPGMRKELIEALEDIHALYDVADDLDDLEALLDVLRPEGAIDLSRQTSRQLLALLLNLTTGRLPPYLEIRPAERLFKVITSIIAVVQNPNNTFTALEAAKNLAESINEGRLPRGSNR